MGQPNQRCPRSSPRFPKWKNHLQAWVPGGRGAQSRAFIPSLHAQASTPTLGNRGLTGSNQWQQDWDCEHMCAYVSKSVNVCVCQCTGISV